METKDILKKLREDNNLTQDQMADKLLGAGSIECEVIGMDFGTARLKIPKKRFCRTTRALIALPHGKDSANLPTIRTHAHELAFPIRDIQFHLVSAMWTGSLASKT